MRDVERGLAIVDDHIQNDQTLGSVRIVSGAPWKRGIS
jgi:hypothetical protein